MSLTKKELAVLNRFGFDIPPVGVKFLVKQLDVVVCDIQVTSCRRTT
jgi:hypothetical protein